MERERERRKEREERRETMKRGERRKKDFFNQTITTNLKLPLLIMTSL